jgi:hypothetical protein
MPGYIMDIKIIVSPNDPAIKVYPTILIILTAL